MTKRITMTELAALLEGFTGASFCTVETATAPDMLAKHRVTKEANPFIGRVTRTAERSGMLGASYERAVNNRRDTEGHSEEFRAESMWKGVGEHVSKALIRHKGTGKLYMVFYPSHNAEGSVTVRESEWFVDGSPLSAEELAPYLPARREGSGRQETERAVPWRVIALENVRALNVGGKRYEIAL